VLRLVDLADTLTRISPLTSRSFRNGVVRVSRLFAGTPWDRPPTCDRCGRLESECSCPPLIPEVNRIPPQQQTARLMTERRAKGKLVTVIAGLVLDDNDLNELATRLKNACGAGGTVKDALIELQGDHLQPAERTLQAIGYKTKVRGR
jgi:translation initiation factor 1